MAANHSTERRRGPRISFPFPARVRGVDASGSPFKLDTLIENLSAEGLYLKMNRGIMSGTELAIAIRLSAASVGLENSTSVATRGIVLRTELQPDGTCGVAVRFTRHRLL
ncbi:MAG: PilZ domain-containing protein [Blastocatellia bacterium]